MLRISNCLKIVPKRHFNMPLLHRTLTSYDIRNQFLDYFIKSNYQSMIRTSPVVAFCNSFAAFVNPDKNRTPGSDGTVNSRKHVDVGEQNHPTIVGTDDSHQRSFYEMLGSWSFSDDFKKGPGELTRNLYKVPCRNNSSRQYGTYFTDGNEPLKDFIDIEMKNVLENSPKESYPFIVHFLTCATLLESVHLQKATRLCTDRPIIVLSSTDNQIKARCCVPQNFITDKFSAQLWLTTVANCFETEICLPPSEQSMDEVCHMKPKKLTSVIFDERLEIAMHRASDFAKINM